MKIDKIVEQELQDPEFKEIFWVEKEPSAIEISQYQMDASSERE